MTRRAGLLVALAAALMMIGGTLAFAAVDSKVTFRIGNGGKFKGKVTAADDDCVIGRKVLIIQTIPERERLAKTFASESGRYAVPVPADAGNEFFARIKGYETPQGTLCRGDRSRKVNAG